MAKNTQFNLTIKINGKEVKNTVTGVRREISSLTREINKTTRGTKEYERKTRELRKAKGVYANMRKEIHGVSQSLKTGKSQLKLFGAAFLGAFAVSGVFSSVSSFFSGFISDAVRLNEEAKGINYAFNQIKDSSTILSQARKATSGLVSDLDIKKAANTFKNFKLDLEPFPELLKFTATRAAQTGENFDQMLSSLVEGLSKESKLRIDNLGISQKELNEELERTPDFVQAVANIAKKELAKAGPILDSAANANQKWNVALENAQVRVGKLIEGSGLVSFFKKVGASILDSIAPSEDLIKSFESQADKVIKLEETLPPLIDEYEHLKSKSKLNKEEQERLKEVVEKISQITPSAITAFDQYGNAMDISTRKAKVFIETQRVLLKFRNKEAIEEQTKALKKYERQIEKLDKALKERDQEGYVVEKESERYDFYRRLSDEEIRIKREKLTKLKELEKGALEIKDQLTGDYLEKYKGQQEQQTKAALNEARKRADALLIPYSKEATAAEINALIAKQERINAENNKNSEKQRERLVKDNEKLLEKQQEYREKIILGSKTLIEQENAAHNERLKQAGLFNKSRNALTDSELLTLETLEANHHLKIAKIELEAVNKHLAKKQKTYESEKTDRQITFNNELAEIETLESAKEILKKRLSDEELNKIDSLQKAKAELRRGHEASELEKQAEYLQSLISLYTNALNSGEIEGVNLADKILTEEQKEILNEQLEQVRLKLSEVALAKNKISGQGEEEGGVDLSGLDGVDILGFTPEQWQQSFSNLDAQAGKIKAVEAVLGGLQNAWGKYSNFLTENEKRQLQTLERSHKKKKDSLKRQLDAGIIDQNTYNNKVESLDNELARKKAEIEYRQAKRERTAALMGIISNTALGIMKAVSTFWMTGGLPWSVIIGAMGAAQAALVLSKPLPDRGYVKGGFTSSLGYKDHTGEKVAGIVHDGEYVVPKFVLRSSDPAVPQVLRYLENKRKEKLGFFKQGGFSQGGFNQIGVTSTTADESTRDNSDALDVESEETDLAQVLKQLKTLLSNGIKTGPVVIGDDQIEELRIRNNELEGYRNDAKNLI